MRHNPYLKNRRIFLPLLMRGSNRNSAISSENTARALFEPRLNSYSVKGISFETVQPSRLNDRLYPLAKIYSVEMCSTECTQELFEAVMGFNPSGFKGKADSPKRPVERVSWFDCIAFCNKLSQELGLAPYYSLTRIKYDRQIPQGIAVAFVNVLGGNGFRLPTADEWLLFARAGIANRWSGTNIEAELEDYAWYEENSNNETHPVATKKPNKWGMYDMSGNVWEWCWDTYTSTLKERVMREEDGRAFRGDERVMRGGSWVEESSYLWSEDRYDYSPFMYGNDLGFRFCRSID